MNGRNVFRANLTRNTTTATNDENVAPSLQKPAAPIQRSGLQNAARRRRARATGSQNTITTSASSPRRKQQLKSKPTVATMTFTIPAQAQDVEMAEASTSAQPQPALRPLTLPVYLQRPAFKGIAKDTLAAIDPELRDVQPQYIRDQLANLGSSMVQTVCSVKAAPITGALPKTMPIHVTDCASEPPTHMLGIYANTPLPNESVGAAAAPKQKVTLFPAHDVVLASYCANLPILPRGNDQGTSTPSPDGVKTALDITLPIIPFCIPSPSTFAPLLRFMYTRDPTALQRTLFPCALPTSHIDIFDSAQEGAAGLRVDFAKRIADTYRGQVLMRHVMVIQGMWRNVCVLGIEDKAVWDTIDAAWNVMVLAVAIALKDTASMTAMVGGKERAEELALL